MGHGISSCLVRCRLFAQHACKRMLVCHMFELSFASIYHYDKRLFQDRFLGEGGEEAAWLYY